MSNSIGSTNLSSELLLNKIMNGSVKTESGKTVTMGNRATSSQLNLDAIAPSISSANAKAGSAQATAIQGRLSEMKDYLENLKKEVESATVDTVTSLAADAAAYVNKVAGSKVDGKAVFATASGEGITPATANEPISVDMGFGDTLSLEAEAAGKAMSAVGTALVKTAAIDEGTLTTWQSEAHTAIDAALKSIYDEMGASTQNIRTLDSRSAILDNVAETYVDAAASQSVVASGGASNLLTGVLG